MDAAIFAIINIQGVNVKQLKSATKIKILNLVKDKIVYVKSILENVIPKIL